MLELHPDAAFDETALRALCRQRRAGYRVPKDLVLVEEVRRNPVGKADYRWAPASAGAALAQPESMMPAEACST